MDDDRQYEGLDLHAMLAAARRRRGVVIACLVLAPLAAIAVTLGQGNSYSAEATLLFRFPGVEQRIADGPVDYSQDRRSGDLATTLAYAAAIEDRTEAALGVKDVSDDVELTQESESDLVTITAEGDDPASATRLADTYAREYVAFGRERDLEAIRQTRQTAVGREVQELRDLERSDLRSIQLVRPAELERGSGATVLRNAILGLVLGAFLAVALVFVLERLDRSLKDSREVTDVFGRPILAAVPYSRALSSSPTGPLSTPEADAFSLLRANLRHFYLDREPRSILITSSDTGEGASTVALHLAATAAAAGLEVLLVEADLHRPVLAERLQLSSAKGLVDVLASEAELAEVVETVSVAAPGDGVRGVVKLDVVAAGEGAVRQADSMKSDRAQTIVEAAEREYDLTILDAPPINLVADAIALARPAAGVLVVARLGGASRESATRLATQLRNLDARVLGIVLNSVRPRDQISGDDAARERSPSELLRV